MIDICLATFNSIEWTKRFIVSLEKNTFSDHEIIVVDNGSTDGTVDFLKRIPNVCLFEEKENTGCAIAWNKALRNSRSNFKVLTQNDVIFQKNWDRLLLDFMEENPDCDAVSATGVDNFLLEQEEFDRLLPVIQCNGYIRNAFFVPCVLFRDSLFSKIGYFDETLGKAYYEDADFSIRMYREGIKFFSLAYVTVCHYGSRTTARVIRSAQESKDNFKKKWQGKDVYVPLVYEHMDSAIMRGSVFSWSYIKSILRGIGIEVRELAKHND